MIKFHVLFECLIFMYAAMESYKIVRKLVSRVPLDVSNRRYADLLRIAAIIAISMGPIGHYGLILIDQMHT